jgi:hypothetical protein
MVGTQVGGHSTIKYMLYLFSQGSVLICQVTRRALIGQSRGKIKYNSKIKRISNSNWMFPPFIRPIYYNFLEGCLISNYSFIVFVWLVAVYSFFKKFSSVVIFYRTPLSFSKSWADWSYFSELKQQAYRRLLESEKVKR